MDERRFKVGELARIAGLTVRTLHHWDQLGLLTPSERTGASYRLYGPEDVKRLYRILALRSIGLPLDQVSAALDEDVDLRSIVERQLAELERRIALEQQLRDKLVQVLESPEHGDVIETIEVMTMIEQYYTPEQLETLARRREELGPEGMVQAQHDWAEVIAQTEAELRRGTDPADPRVQTLAARWQALMDAFSGGDPEILAAAKRMYRDQGTETASRGMLKPEVAGYIRRAQQAGG